MTREEAAEIISKLYISAGTKKKIMQVKQALKIAIEALRDSERGER